MKELITDETKVIINRLSRISGQVEAIKRMTENRRDCNDILTQISAAKSALDSTAKIILQNHINSCIEDIIKRNDETAIDDLNSTLTKLFR
ncbi:metal-sensitive transcriptional regulator [Clostridium kluyveri]|uniref:metal-sensitive transcriptional regulator n=1 Tax=Clostridium kluyveri TaxID=1534 RepID=UPI00224846AE|nr:metal-sensitive transcriptional regulator [Clostridium kluyveri]UZQ48917.1 metal-sensing transcriptional repressor [Clostridium kluyveri]